MYFPTSETMLMNCLYEPFPRTSSHASDWNSQRIHNPIFVSTKPSKAIEIDLGLTMHRHLPQDLLLDNYWSEKTMFPSVT